jgi:hypothetical protein
LLIKKEERIMAEYGYGPVQTVAAGQPIIMDAITTCQKNNVYHREGSGLYTLPSAGCRGAKYAVEFNGNIAIPDGGTVGEISVGLVLDGEVIQTSIASVTPTATDAFFNVTVLGQIQVPAICGCESIAIENVQASPAGTVQSINVRNANLTINRIA